MDKQRRKSMGATNACCCLEEPSDWRKCEAVARILVTCPQQSASAERYYTTVCPQVGTQTCLSGSAVCLWMLKNLCVSLFAFVIADP